VRFDLVGKARKIEDLGERLRFLIENAEGDRAGVFLRDTTLRSLAYTARPIPEISDSIADVDNAMRWGFGPKLGPFELWDTLGVAKAAEMMRQQEIAVAPWVEEMLAKGVTSFYRRENNRVTGVYKRWNMLILFVIGLTLAVALNADTFSICKALWVNPALRQAVAEAATKYVKEHAPPATGEAPVTKSTPAPETLPTTQPATSPTTKVAKDKADDAVPSFPAGQIKELVTEVHALKLLPSWSARSPGGPPRRRCNGRAPHPT
jgi:hypothetical protein